MANKPKLYSLLILFASFSIFLLFISIIFFILEYHALKDETYAKLSARNQTNYTAFLTELQYHEKLLLLLSEELKKIDVLQNPEASRPLIEKLLKIDKTLAGFGIARADGQLIIISNVPKEKTLPNLLNDPKSKKSFLKTIQQKNMLLGDTYYMPLLDRYVLPIRIPIYSDGNILFIMTAGIDLEADHAWNQRNNDEIISGIIGRNYRTIYSSYDIALSGKMTKPYVLQHNKHLKPFQDETMRTFTTPTSFGNLFVVTKANLTFNFLYATALPLKSFFIKYLYRILPFVIIGVVFYTIFTYLFIVYYRQDNGN